MAKTCISDISDYLNDTGLLKDMPATVRRMAEFLTAIVETETRHYPTIGHATGIRCRKRGCKGSILASLQTADDNVTWWCPLCEQYGVISGWQGTKWDHTAARSAAKPKLVPNYTPREGQYLAFIYYYTKLHRRSPAEHDMQLYFRVSPPAIHDMLLRLEKRGCISREPGVPRSIRLLLKREQLPDLE